MNPKLKNILLKMNKDAHSQGKQLPFPPTKRGYQKLLRIIQDIKIKQRKGEFKS